MLQMAQKHGLEANFQFKQLNNFNLKQVTQLFYYHSQLYYLGMSSFIPYQQTIAYAFSIAGLATVGPFCYFFRDYSRILDYVQLIYIFTSAYAASVVLFSNMLGYGFLNFMPTFLNSYCNSGDYLCTYGYLISPAICWLAITLLMLIIIKIVSCKKNSAKFQPFYNFWKGIIRWFMAPLVYYSTQIVVTKIQENKFDSTFIAAAAVDAFFLIWMFVQLIGYKCIQGQEQNNWKKWVDFFNTFRILSVVVLVVISTQVNSLAKYFIYGPILFYDIVHLVKYKFTFKVLERITFIIDEAVIITLFSLFLFNTSYISTYNLDLFGLAIVIFFDLFVMFIPKLCNYCKRDGDSQGEVNPEKRDPFNKKINPYDDIMAEKSRQNLGVSNVSSPRRNNNSPSPKRR